MGKKRINTAFLEAYVELDKQCATLLKTYSGGVNEYINNLMVASGIYGREETVTRLVKYKGIRNRIAHVAGAIRADHDLTRADVRWIKNFAKSIGRKKDPLSEHTSKHARGKFRRFLQKFSVAWVLFDMITIAAIVWGAIEIWFK